MRAAHVSIRQIGNSQGFVIPKPILEQLGLSRGTEAEIAIEGDALYCAGRPVAPALAGRTRLGRLPRPETTIS
jgi:antitoxin component of MazEF toxin-antitoxin module